MPLNYLLLVLIFVACSGSVWSQVTINRDTNAIYSSPYERLSYEPDDLIADIQFAVRKYPGGYAGVEFVFVTNKKDAPANINIDSFFLKSPDNGTLLLNRPFRDTLYFRKNGGLFFYTLHFIKGNAITFLKENLVTTMLLPVNNDMLVIRLSKRSQQKILAIANKAYN
jgi:hypothetical protein